MIFKKIDIPNPATRSVTVNVENIYLRFLEAYVLYLGADGNPIIGKDGKPVSPEKLKTIQSNCAIMGIPLLADATLEETHLTFQMPAAASYASLLFGTVGVGSSRIDYKNLGLGKYSYDACSLCGDALAWTLVINIGIPTLLLTLGVGLSSSSFLKSISEDGEILLAIAAVLVPMFIAGEMTRGVVQGTIAGPVCDTANVLIAICIKCIPRLAAKVFGYAGAKEAEEAIPFIGWAVRVLSMIGGIAQLAQTTGEILSSPPVLENTVCISMSTTITVQHDPRDFAFPATARKYIVRGIYDGTLVREVCRTLSTTRSDPIVETFNNIPIGGTVHFDVWFLSDDNWVCGYAGTGHWENTDQIGEDGQPVQRWVPESVKNFPAQAGAVNLVLKENLVPLTATTTYHHREKIGYRNGTHVWLASAAPTATQLNLDTTRNTGLHALNGITVSQTAAAVGYSWRTGAPHILPCPGESSSAVSLNLLQSLSLTQRPNDAWKGPVCGQVAKPAIAYDMMAELGSHNLNFYVDPVYGPYQIGASTVVPYKYFVRSVIMDHLTDTTSFTPLKARVGAGSVRTPTASQSIPSATWSP